MSAFPLSGEPTSGTAPPSSYQPPASPAYTSSTKLPPPRAATAAPGATITPPPTPGAHLAGGGGGKGRRGWIIAAVVLVIALVGGGAAFAFLGGDDDSDDDAAPASTEGTETTGAPETSDDPTDAAVEPVDVTRAFFIAALASDCPGMADLLTENSLLAENDSVEEGLAECEESFANGDSGFEGMTVGNISLVSVNGDVAVVSVDFDIEGQASTEQFTLRMVDGAWKLDLEASA